MSVLGVLHDTISLFIPRHCAGCDRPLHRTEGNICLVCLSDLPRTRFHDDPDNRIELLFRGCVQLEAASAFLHFSRSGRVQHILHRLKYRGDREAGLTLGRLMGREVKECARFHTVDTVLAVPLHRRKERARGYNQSQILVDGLREEWPLTDAQHGLQRVVRTATQTKRGRLDRWRNVMEAFEVSKPALLEGKHILLVDDVVTTGATMESCIRTLQQVPGVRVSVLTAACA
mgnify:CR=1 FL=1